MRRRGLLGVVGAACAALALGAASPAAADVTVSVSGTELRVAMTGDSAAPSDIRVEHFADGTRNGIRVRPFNRFTSPGAVLTSDPQCFANPLFNDVVCDGLPTKITMTMGSGQDKVYVGESTVGCEVTSGTPVAIDFGPGDDFLTALFCAGGPNPARLTGIFDASGGSGNDVLQGRDFDDVLRGDTGNDELYGSLGNDRLEGGNGGDQLFGTEGDDALHGGPGSDLVDGGPGVDSSTIGTVLSGLSPAAVRVTLDNAANDGTSGEGDNYVRVERLIGGDGRDTFTGSNGDETFRGMGGNDVLTGLLGIDALDGGSGDDILDIRDGVRESVICGFGQDQVIADLVDDVPVVVLIRSRNDDVCERVERFAVDDGPPSRVTTRSARVPDDGTLRLRVACPAKARIACAGALTLVDPRRPRTVLAAADYEVRIGRAALVELELSRAEAATLRARGLAHARTREAGVSRKGPRSSLQAVAIVR